MCKGVVLLVDDVISRCDWVGWIFKFKECVIKFDYVVVYFVLIDDLCWYVKKYLNKMCVVDMEID